MREKLLPFIISSGIAIMLLSPLPYGSVETWSVSLFEIFAFVTFGAWITAKILKGRIQLPNSPFYIPMGLFFLLIIFQTIRLPMPVLDIISPHTAMLWQSKGEALRHIFGENIGLSNTISLYPYVTKEKLLLYISYAVFFLVTADYIRRSRQIKRFFWIIFAVAIIESLIGILQYILSGTAIRASGTYVNPNHFAGLLLVVIPLFLGYLLYAGTARGDVSSRRENKTTARFSAQLILLFAASLMAISLILSQSRGAIFSLAASILFFYTAFSLNKKSKSVKWLLGLFFVIILLYSLWIGLDPVIEKFAETREELPKRTYIWKDSAHLIKDFPIFGAGLGNFSLAYTMYKNEAYWARLFNHAHNDYIELAAETGLLGLILVLWAITVFYKSAIAVLKDSVPHKDPLRFYLLLGCLSGMFGMLIHAITEFNFQIPANTYYFTFLLGLSVSLSNHLSGEKIKS